MCTSNLLQLYDHTVLLVTEPTSRGCLPALHYLQFLPRTTTATDQQHIIALKLLHWQGKAEREGETERDREREKQR